MSGVKPVSEAADDLSYMMSSPLMHIESFLEALTNANKDGRIVINKQGNILTRLVMKREHSRRTGSVQWLLMPWLLMSPDQQQPWLFWGCTVHRPAREYKNAISYAKEFSKAMYPKNFHDSTDICLMGLVYTMQICEISDQTFGPSHRKCPMWLMNFMITA